MQQIATLMYFSRFQCGVVTLQSAMSHLVWKKLFDAVALASLAHWIRDAASVSRCCLSCYHEQCLLQHMYGQAFCWFLLCSMPSELEDWVASPLIYCRCAGYCGSWRLLWFRQCNPPFDLVASFALDMLQHVTPVNTSVSLWSCAALFFGCRTFHSISLNFTQVRSSSVPLTAV